jgi:hypothetical protein
MGQVARHCGIDLNARRHRRRLEKIPSFMRVWTRKFGQFMSSAREKEA